MTPAQRTLAVVAVAALLGAGTWALVRLVPPSQGAQVGQRAPDYRVARIEGGDSIGLRSGYAGHVTLVNIWATWCAPCQAEMPSIERLFQAYQARGFRVAATSIDTDGPGLVREYAHRLGLSFDILSDRSGGIQQAYQTVGVPESFLIDKRGRIAYRSLGADSWDSPENRLRVERLLAAGD